VFGDGHYVESGNNLQNCIDALNKVLNVQVSGSAECEGNTCKAEGKASANCGAAPTDTRADGAFFAFGALAVLGGVAAKRRRRS